MFVQRNDERHEIPGAEKDELNSRSEEETICKKKTSTLSIDPTQSNRSMAPKFNLPIVVLWTVYITMTLSGDQDVSTNMQEIETLITSFQYLSSFASMEHFQE